jgi:hypothetical protein
LKEKAFSFVEVHEDEKSPYNPEFVEKIKPAEKEKEKVMTNAKDLWESVLNKLETILMNS